MSMERDINIPAGDSFRATIKHVGIDSDRNIMYMELVLVNKSNFKITEHTLQVPQDQFGNVADRPIPPGASNVRDALSRSAWQHLADRTKELVGDSRAVVVPVTP